MEKDLETENVEQEVSDQEQTEQEGAEEFDVNQYLDDNGLINKWETTGMFEEVKTNSEKFFIASIMEAMIYRTVEMIEREGKSQEEMLLFQEKYLTYMRELGVFNGSLLSKFI